MARQFGGVELVYLVYVLPANFRTTPIGHLAMQLRIAFFTALLSYIFANDCFIPMTAYGTDEITFGPKLTPHKRFLTVETQWKISPGEPSSNIPTVM